MAKKNSNQKETNEPFDPQNMGGAKEAHEGKTYDPDQVVEPLESILINSDVRKPKWKTNKYPVSREEYEKLLDEAEAMDDDSGMTLAATDETTEDDEDDGITVSLSDEVGEDLPEDSAFSFSPTDLAPGISSRFQTIPATGWIPPDCVCATGRKEVVVAVNSEYRIYNKQGTELRRRRLASLFSAVLPNSSSIKVFDPRIIYDHYNHRFVMIAAATRNAPQGSWLCIAVSKTSSAIGSWTVWSTNSALNGSHPTSNWGDYPMLGFDSEAIYVSMNMFNGGSFQYSKLRIFNNKELYASQPLRYYDFWGLNNPNGSRSFTVQPCEHYRGRGPGPAYLINNYWASGNKLVKWKLTNPLAYWSGGSPSLSRVDVSCRSYSLPPRAKQKGSSTRVNTNDNRLLSAVYQHAGGTRRIWAVQNTKISWNGDSEARSALRWYEVDVSSDKVVQQNNFGARGMYYFFPSIQVDIRRNAYIVFGRCSPSLFPQLRITGRKVTGGKNDLESSRLVKAGESAHNSGRYGDYFGIGRDGADQNRVYGVGEYAESSGRWGTYVVSAKY